DDDFFEDGLEPVGEGDVVGGDAADHEGCGLGAGVSATAGEQGDEEGQGDDFGECFFEGCDDAGGYQVDGDEEGEPADAFLDELPDGGFAVAGFEGLDGAGFVEVFGGFFFGDVEHVVDGDDTDQDAV